MKFFRSIASGFYSIGVHLRNWMYDAGVKKSRKFKIPIICVGNITVGGTGKTPVIEFLMDELGKRWNPAVLSRGYKRRTKGYLEVETNSSYLNVGDEPKQIKRKFPDSVVAVCENRCEGVKEIRRRHPEVNMILMDDGFQHRRITPKVNIVLMDFTRPIYHDSLLPLGSLRDIPSQMHRANIVLVTKTPETISPIDRRIVVKELDLFPYQQIFFTSMVQGTLKALFPNMAEEAPRTRNVAMLAGIGNPLAMQASLAQRYNVVSSFVFKDHHIYKVRDLNRIIEDLKELPADTIIITTEKDAVKLSNRKKVPEELQRRLYVIPLKLNFFEGDKGLFLQKLYNDVTNRED